ncbi:MAG: hypothetical protein L6Q92_01580 [Phycisphaerae bacterium]|nr:hypothetical protein [Phycisphaerae bacterium]
MATYEAFIATPSSQLHEVEIERRTVIAFWRLGRALATNAPRDREVFTLGRCIGSTTGITATIQAFGEGEDPARSPMSILMYGGDQPMLDAYWQSVDDPVVFRLAREVYRLCPEFDECATDARADESGVVVFDISGEHARLIGLRFTLSRRAK